MNWKWNDNNWVIKITDNELDQLKLKGKIIQMFNLPVPGDYLVEISFDKINKVMWDAGKLVLSINRDSLDWNFNKTTPLWEYKAHESFNLFLEVDIFSLKKKLI